MEVEDILAVEGIWSAIGLFPPHSGGASTAQKSSPLFAVCQNNLQPRQVQRSIVHVRISLKMIVSPRLPYPSACFKTNAKFFV